MWRFRYYPDTDSFVGVPVNLPQAEAGGLLRDGIYVMGGTRQRADGTRVSPFDEQPLFVGLRVMDFVPPNPDDPILCPSHEWRVNGVCTRMLSDFALDFSLENVVAVDGTFENVRFAAGRNGGTAAVFPARAMNFLVYLKVPHRPSLQFTTEVTVDFWTKLDSSLLEPWWRDASLPGYCSELIAKTENETGLRIDACPNPDRSNPATRVLYLGLFSVPNFVQEHNGGPYGPLDEWTRITVTQSSVDGYKLYVNGRLAASNANHRGDFAVINRSDLFVGGGSPANALGRGAWIQSLRIYQRAMTASEVGRLNL